MGDSGEAIIDITGLYPPPPPPLPRHRALLLIPRTSVAALLLGQARVVNVPSGSTCDPFWFAERFADEGCVAVMIEHPSLPLDQGLPLLKVLAVIEP